MIRLLNKSDKTYEFKLTKNPVTNPQQSPRPTGKLISELDPQAMNFKELERTILNHPNYSESKTVYLEPGVNEYKNEEHAEYIYATLGNPEESGEIPRGREWVPARMNTNFVLEVDEKGDEIKTNLWEKYRRQTGVQMVRHILA